MAGARSERRWWRLWRVLERGFEWDRERTGRATYRTCYLGEGKALARVLERGGRGQCRTERDTGTGVSGRRR